MRIPAYIMVPVKNEVVQCWGVDYFGNPFDAVPAKYFAGVWKLLSEDVVLGRVLYWEMPDGIVDDLNTIQVDSKFPGSR